MSKLHVTERQALIEQHRLFISCVVPVHNEQEGITRFIAALTQTLQSITERFEIILVDDGSTDDTRKILATLNPHPALKVLYLSRNFGKETALAAGLEYSQGQVAILIDSDFQHPLTLLPEFIHEWGQGFDMVYGVRQNRDHEPYLKRSLTRLFYKMMASGTHIDIVPNAGDFRLLDKQVISAMNQCHERSRFMKGLYAWVGFKSKGLPFKVAERPQGTSSWRFKSLAELAITGFISFSNVPLRVWSLFGFIISALSFAYASFLTLRTAIFGIDVPGYASLMVAITFFGGIQLLSIGILGEYIARIFNEVKQRPKYIIESKQGFEQSQEMIEASASTSHYTQN